MSKSARPSACNLADLIVYLSRLGQASARCAETAPQSLTAAQWTALRYFARANRFSRTPSAFSEFHATTRGTASQTVKSLVVLGLLRRQSHESDARSTVIEITEAGREILRHDPLEDLRKALERLAPERRDALADALGQTIVTLAEDRKAPVFGSCSECNHCHQDDGSYFCLSTRSFLSLPEMQAICVDFEPSAR